MFENMPSTVTEVAVQQKNPYAGIGRQGDLKIRWFIIINVQVVLRVGVTTELCSNNSSVKNEFKVI